MMHQSEFDAANVALSRAADKRKSLINIHKNRYTATLSCSIYFLIDSERGAIRVESMSVACSCDVHTQTI